MCLQIDRLSKLLGENGRDLDVYACLTWKFVMPLGENKHTI